jgi:ATP-dependent Lon protease
MLDEWIKLGRFSGDPSAALLEARSRTKYSISIIIWKFPYDLSEVFFILTEMFWIRFHRQKEIGWKLSVSRLHRRETLHIAKGFLVPKPIKTPVREI